MKYEREIRDLEVRQTETSWAYIPPLVGILKNYGLIEGNV